ncbi:MAG: putative manganese transporter [Bacteroidales bacterium]|jgi:hypothetical protein|nr:putative manganese transporter [Bacteroidales bacterium]
MHHLIAAILQNTVMITSFVLVMMLLIEYINVGSKGKWIHSFQGSKYKQVLLAALLGVTPGCLGGFAVVSLFTHNIFNFGALIACMIATFGDEAFVMLAIIPETAFLLSAVILVIAVVTGLLTNLLIGKFPAPFDRGHFALHASDRHGHANIRGNWRENLKHVSFERALLIAGIAALIVAILTGWFEHAHEAPSLHDAHDAAHPDCRHGVFPESLLKERWLNILFVAVCLVALFIIGTVRDHFLKEHLWAHIVKKHLPRIFLWTLGVITILQIGQQFADIDGWVRQNRMSVLALAVLIGLIPESGPHIVFISLFADGLIPFSVLLTNSIVQEGHAGLPLFAESKKGFLWMKAISVLVGLLVGATGYLAGF